MPGVGPQVLHPKLKTPNHSPIRVNVHSSLTTAWRKLLPCVTLDPNNAIPAGVAPEVLCPKPINPVQELYFFNFTRQTWFLPSHRRMAAKNLYNAAAAASAAAVAAASVVAPTTITTSTTPTTTARTRILLHPSSVPALGESGISRSNSWQLKAL